MKVRRTLAGFAVASVVSAAGIVGAPTASAAGVSFFCGALNGTSGAVSLSTASIAPSPGLAAGEVVSVTVGVSSGAPVVSLGVPAGTVRSSGAAPTVLTYTAVGGETSVTAVNSGTGAFTFTWSCQAPANPVPAAPIPDWVQAFARANKDVTCPDGWNPSWDQWPNGGKGGYVCTRSIPAYGS